MAFVGQQLDAGRIPGERIATNEVTGNSSDFTGVEAVVATVTAAVVSGRTYRIRFAGAFSTDSSGDRLFPRIREDNVSGTELTHENLFVNTTNANGEPLTMEVEFTATTTSSKTFVLTGDVVGGSGPARLRGLTIQPSYLYVDYIRG